MQWPFSSKSSGPRLLSFGSPQDELPKLLYDPLPVPSSALAAMFTYGAFEPDPNNLSASQVASILEKRGAIPAQAPVSSWSSQPLARAPVTVTPPVCPAGTTDSRNASSQMTIFYNGSVLVYDNITPEKAQAIMLLAGNRPPPTSVRAAAEPYGLSLSQPCYSDRDCGEVLGTISQLGRKSLARFVEKRKERVMIDEQGTAL